MMNSANLKALSKSIYIQLYEVNDILNGEGVSLALPVLKIGLNNGEKVPVSDGTAVIKADKLVGYLDSLETKYFSFIKEEIEGGLILISVDSDVENTSLEILSAKRPSKQK
jgi:spore germination protein KC